MTSVNRWQDAFGTHEFEEQSFDVTGSPRTGLTCRACRRAFRVNESSLERWAVSPDGRALAKDTTERWLQRPCPCRPLDSDQILHDWQTNTPVEDEIRIGRAIAQGRAEDLLDDLSLERALDWHHEFKSHDEWLAIATEGGREVVKFSHDEIADCSSEGPDGRELRAAITAKVTQAVKKLSGAKDRIGF
jgi:hypothetical protein